MAKEEVNNIFREVASMAGDIVFCYDLVTKKFMQYSDKTELFKYGSWLYDFENTMVNSKMIYSEDIGRFQEIVRRIKNGEKGTIEGMFRMRIHASGDYRWHRLLARANYENDKPVEVIGKITDIHAYIMEHKKKMSDEAEQGGVEGFSDRDSFTDSMLRYIGEHKEESMIACILFDIPEYDSVIRGLDKKEAGAFRVNLLQRIRRSFPSGSVIGRIGVHRFGVCMGGLGMPAEAGKLIGDVQTALDELGFLYKTPLNAYAGICLEHNRRGVEEIIFDNAQTALAQTGKKDSGNVVFFSERKAPLAERKADTSSGQDDFIVEYALRMFGGYDSAGKGAISHLAASLGILMEKIGTAYGFERISVSLCRGRQYEEYVQWRSPKIKNLPKGSLLHVQGLQSRIEETITFWGPYVVNNVEAYPDDSPYGRMMGITAVKSILQGGFECGNGVRVIVSLEYYTTPHTWTKEELELLERTRYIADFCASYVR